MPNNEDISWLLDHANYFMGQLTTFPSHWIPGDREMCTVMENRHVPALVFDITGPMLIYSVYRCRECGAHYVHHSRRLFAK